VSWKPEAGLDAGGEKKEIVGGAREKIGVKQWRNVWINKGHKGMEKK